VKISSFSGDALPFPFSGTMAGLPNHRSQKGRTAECDAQVFSQRPSVKNQIPAGRFGNPS
jgi:hypothetical protein